MSAETVLRDLRTALADLYLAGLGMPRHTPDPGGAGTEHVYRLSAANVWDHDKAMKRAVEVLGITDVPGNCCVGARNFDEATAEHLRENARRILRR
jgi:hypothetical protein